MNDPTTAGNRTPTGLMDIHNVADRLRTRVLDEPIAVLAQQLGCPTDTIRHRRRRADLVLRDAV